MSTELFNQYINTMYIEKKKLDAFWKQYKLEKEKVKNASLVSLQNRKLFASILRLNGSYFGELNLIKGIDFSFTDLSFLDLSGLIFEECNFESAILHKTSLDLGTFDYCNLKNSNFTQATLELINFYGCSLKNSNFDKAYMINALFDNCNLSKTSFKGANLLELEVKNTTLDGIIIDNNTAINKGTFENVDWSRVDVSNLNISVDQTKYFLDCSKGLSKTQVYDDKYNKSNIQEIQDSIFIDLCNLDIINTDSYSNSTLDIFISYAREKEEQASSLANKLKPNFEVWWDQHLQDGDKLSEIVRQTICNCKIAVVLLSKEYLIKGWPRYEFFELIRKARTTQFKLIIVNDNSNTHSSIDFDTVKKELKGDNSDNFIFADTTDAVYDLITQHINC